MKPTNDSQKEAEQDPFPLFVGPYVRIIELKTFIGQVDTTHLLQQTLLVGFISIVC